MYPSTSFQRSHVLHVHVFSVSPALHIDMQFTSDVIIKMTVIIGFQTYSNTFLGEAMYTPYILSRNHVHLVHIFIISPALHISMQFIWDVIIKIIAIIGFQTYSNTFLREAMYTQYILSRSHVHLVHPSEELCIPYTSFREAMYSKGVLSSFHPHYIQACISHEMTS